MRERGASLVEQIFVLVLFMAVLLGVTDLARILHLHSAVSDRVRDAARRASIHGYTPQQVRRLIVYGGLQAPEDGETPYYGLSESNVRVDLFEPGTANGRIRVEVRGMKIAAVSPFLNGLARNLPFSVTVPLETP